MDIAKGKIGNALTSTANNHVVAVAEDIYDENLQKYQSEINQEKADVSYVDSEIASAVSAVYKVKGSVQSYSLLPSNAKVGDVYNILDSGSNYVWTEDGWDKLSETVDLSPYAAKDEVVWERGGGTNSAKLKNASATASSPYAIASGYKSVASAQGAEASGRVTVAASKYSHAEGYGSATGDGEVTALDSDGDAGYAAHAEGISTKAAGRASHSEGRDTTALSDYSHSQGQSTFAGQKAYRYHAINTSAKRMSFDGFVPGFEVGDIVSIINDKKYPDCCTIATIVTQGDHNNITFNEAFPFTSLVDDDGFDAKLIYVSAKPGVGNVDLGMYAHSEGWGTKAQNTAAHAEGRETKALGEYSHAEGRETIAQYAAHAEGLRTQATSTESHAEGMDTVANNTASHAEGARTTASGAASHAEGADTIASGLRSHAEGDFSKATSQGSHAEGRYAYALGNMAHAEGYNTLAGKNDGIDREAGANVTGDYTHAEGNTSVAIGSAAHAEGKMTTALGNFSHAEGLSSYLAPKSVYTLSDDELIESWKNHNFLMADGEGAHAEGINTLALGPYCHAEGRGTMASESSAHAEGG